MKRLFILNFFICFLASARSQDSMDIKKHALIADLKKSFTKPWRLENIESSKVFRWDSLYHLYDPMFRATVHNDTSGNSFVLYFYDGLGSVTPLSKVFMSTDTTKTEEHIFFRMKTDLVVFIISKAEDDLASIDSVLSKEFGFEEPKITLESIRQEEEKEEPPPPPPPKPKKKKG